MGLNIPEFDSPYQNSKIINAYGWITAISLSLRSGSGSYKIDINTCYEDWNKAPIGQVTLSLGDRVKTLDELMQIPEFAQAFQTIAYILCVESLKHPILADANITEV